MADIMPAQAEQVSAESQSALQEANEGGQQTRTLSKSPDLKGSSKTNEEDEHKKREEMSAIEKIKAAQAARRNRRARPQPAETSSPATAPTVGGDSSDDPATAALKNAYEEQVAALRQEAASLRLEMGSLRRNHLQNIKKVSEERDMFAMQLANEQTSSGRPDADNRKLEDINVQLRAARTRNTDLENENAALRDEVKQLNFRVHASKTLDAASDGYEKIVDELVNAKLKCAQLQEEKEDLLRINKELMTTSAVLREANGELEKSRSDWVVRCAELEKQKQNLEDKIQDRQGKGTHNDPSDSGSLQDIKLN